MYVYKGHQKIQNETATLYSKPYLCLFTQKLISKGCILLLQIIFYTLLSPLAYTLKPLGHFFRANNDFTRVKFYFDLLLISN